MKNTAQSLALRIAQLLEEYSPTEMAEAIEILEKYGSSSELLLRYLSEASGRKRSVQPNKNPGGSVTSKPTDQVTSKAVLNLKKSDPQKYRILFEFDKLVRQGEVLATNDALRRFGQTISKDFRPRKALKDNISAVMATLAPLAQTDVEQHIKTALDNLPRQNADQYKKLANYLMHVRRG